MFRTNTKKKTLTHFYHLLSEYEKCFASNALQQMNVFTKMCCRSEEFRLADGENRSKWRSCSNTKIQLLLALKQQCHRGENNVAYIAA